MQNQAWKCVHILSCFLRRLERRSRSLICWRVPGVAQRKVQSWPLFIFCDWLKFLHEIPLQSLQDQQAAIFVRIVSWSQLNLLSTVLQANLHSLFWRSFSLVSHDLILACIYVDTNSILEFDSLQLRHLKLRARKPHYLLKLVTCGRCLS